MFPIANAPNLAPLVRAEDNSLAARIKSHRDRSPDWEIIVVDEMLPIAFEGSLEEFVAARFEIESELSWGIPQVPNASSAPRSHLWRGESGGCNTLWQKL